MTFGTQPAAAYKRGQRIEYRRAGGKIVQGRVIRRQEVHGQIWVWCRVRDEAGEYSGTFHPEQLRLIDNRA